MKHLKKYNEDSSFDKAAEFLGKWDKITDSQKIVFADYIAGMTDRFALNEHKRLFDVTPELR